MLADRLLQTMPVLVTALLIFLSLVPMHVGSVSLTPSVVWLMTLTVGALAPMAWSVVAAFALGLLSDMVLGTPLGAQALLTLFLTMLTHAYARRASHQLFMLRWLEAAGVLLLWHLLLWVLMGVAGPRPPLAPMVITAAASALWFPVFYGLALLLAKWLPARA